jgi:hypothetical protein
LTFLSFVDRILESLKMAEDVEETKHPIALGLDFGIYGGKYPIQAMPRWTSPSSSAEDIGMRGEPNPRSSRFDNPAGTDNRHRERRW